MYVVSNRQTTNRRGLGRFGKKPNTVGGPNELRLYAVSKRNSAWDVDLLDDELHANAVRALARQHGLEIDTSKTWYASLKVVCEIAEEARTQKKNILLFVHGYNNDMSDVLARAESIANRYNLIVVPFSWPANGGGPVTGTASYKSDKRDARASVSAFDRMLLKMDEYLRLITATHRRNAWEAARDRHPDNPIARDSLYSELLEKACPFTVNALFHSMGNYLFKQLLKSTASEASRLNFDNVVLAAADVNNKEHAAWLDNIRCRKRIYVTINENDFALRASRAKAGEAQLARLGHVTYGLNAEKATYVDFTNAVAVGNDHTYFDGTPAADNHVVESFFRDAFNGRYAEETLRYDASRNLHVVG